MIQRIQTLYLFVIVVLSLITLFSPIAGFQNLESAELYRLNYQGLFLIDSNIGELFRTSTWMLTSLMVIVPLICLIVIFLFRKRILQIRLIIFSLVLMAGFYALLFIYLWQFGKVLNATWYLEIVSAFPLINIILSVLSIRAIGKDEALVKSLKRIR